MQATNSSWQNPRLQDQMCCPTPPRTQVLTLCMHVHGLCNHFEECFEERAAQEAGDAGSVPPPLPGQQGRRRVGSDEPGASLSPLACLTSDDTSGAGCMAGRGPSIPSGLDLPSLGSTMASPSALPLVPSTFPQVVHSAAFLS